MDDISRCFNKKDTRAISRLERGMNDIASRDMSSIDARGLKKIRDKRNISFIAVDHSDIRKISFIS